MRNYPVQILNADNDDDATGAAIWVGQAAAASFTVVNGDTDAGGAVKIQGSNEIPVGNYQPQYIPSDESFCNIPNATTTIAAGVGPAIILPTMNFQYIRAVFTSTNAGDTTIIVSASFLQV